MSAFVCSDISVKKRRQSVSTRHSATQNSTGAVECKVKIYVADVACPVVSLGNMIESGFTFNFDEYKCYMHKGDQRVEIVRKRRIFVLRMRLKWFEIKVHKVAPK